MSYAINNNFSITAVVEFLVSRMFEASFLVGLFLMSGPVVNLFYKVPDTRAPGG